MEFWDEWLWVLFVSIGLILVLLELLVGIEAGFDLVALGTVLIIGGLATSFLESWSITAIATSITSAGYILLGRRYIHRRTTSSDDTKTNVDAVIGKSGIVLSAISRNSVGLVRVGNEEWRAGAEEELDEGEEVMVISVSGVTLKVKRFEGGD